MFTVQCEGDGAAFGPRRTGHRPALRLHGGVLSEGDQFRAGRVHRVALQRPVPIQRRSQGALINNLINAERLAIPVSIRSNSGTF